MPHMRAEFLVHVQHELKVEGAGKASTDLKEGHRECQDLHSETRLCGGTLEKELEVLFTGCQGPAQDRDAGNRASGVNPRQRC